jgi:MFS family permease
MRPPSLARNVGLLAFSQALFFMANTIVISTSALVGLQIAPRPSLATVPLGLQFLGTMAATMPASLLMQRVGRRPGLMLGGALGVVAGLIGWQAILHGSYFWFCVAGVVYGAYGAFNQYLRFTAADAADASAPSDPAAARARAIAWVMAGGIVAAVAGPELAKLSRDLWAPVLFAGCYVVIALLAAAGVAAIAAIDIPHKYVAGGSGGRPLAVILRQPRLQLAFIAALVGYITMNLLMTATPLAMMACGFAFADTAFVIQWHVLGMFLPSFWTGSLIARFGAERIIALGAALLLLCIAVHVSGIELGQFVAGLFLLGVGWNLMFIGGTSLLTACYRPEEKARVQGLNDLLMFTTVAASATLSGLLHEAWGWALMNLATVPALTVVLTLVLLRRSGAPAPSTGAR